MPENASQFYPDFIPDGDQIVSTTDVTRCQLILKAHPAFRERPRKTRGHSIQRFSQEKNKEKTSFKSFDLEQSGCIEFAKMVDLRYD